MNENTKGTAEAIISSIVYNNQYKKYGSRTFGKGEGQLYQPTPDSAIAVITNIAV